MNKLLALPLFLFILLGVGMSSAAEDTSTMHMDHSAMKGFNREYMKAMDEMHKPMMSGIMDPDPDAAFVKGMLWHHKGALDMAKIQLKYGKDPAMRKLAQDIIKAQESEIDMMDKWLKDKGVQ